MIRPWDRILRTQRGLGHGFIVGCGCDAAQICLAKSETVGAAQNRANIPGRADVIEQDGQVCPKAVWALDVTRLIPEFCVQSEKASWTGLMDQLSAERDPCLSHTNRAAGPERMSIHQWIAKPTRITDPDLI